MADGVNVGYDVFEIETSIDRYAPTNRHVRKESERFRYFNYADLVARDKGSLDLFWPKDESQDNLDDLPPPDVLQQEIIELLEAASSAFRDVAAALPSNRPRGCQKAPPRPILMSKK